MISFLEYTDSPEFIIYGVLVFWVFPFCTYFFFSFFDKFLDFIIRYNDFNEYLEKKYKK